MNFKGIEIVCPHCRGELDRPAENELACHACRRRFPVILDIPDLRIFPDHYQDVESERKKAFRVAERFHEFNFPGLVDFYYSITDVVTPELAKKYKASLLAAGPRTRAWLTQWEQKSGRASGAGHALLEVGCGSAPLLVAAEKYSLRVGVDIAFRWLVMGKKRLADAGHDIPLLCACAEALPFREPLFDTVVADSTIEHVADQTRALAEMHRVMLREARIFLSTPNRFCPGPDPQTKIWFGTYLPKKWTDAIVIRQGGLAPRRRLLSGGELHKLLAAAGFVDVEIYLPGVPPEQRAHFPTVLRAMMAAYDAARNLPLLRSIMKLLGPMYHAVGRK